MYLSVSSDVHPGTSRRLLANFCSLNNSIMKTCHFGHVLPHSSLQIQVLSKREINPIMTNEIEQDTQLKPCIWESLVFSANC